MANKALVIVESPAKARTINKYLGRNYSVKASVGHIRDLPKSTFGVDIDDNFAPRYVTLRNKKNVIDELRSAAKNADAIYLASDPDREGEAIAWHVSKVLEKEIGQRPIYRVLFNEITRKAVQDALKHPGQIDTAKVDAQQARRILDRIVGYRISPFLWSKISRNLSAGRVQSVALRLVCEREEEILAFVVEEYWSITAGFDKEQQPFEAKLTRIDGKKASIPDEQQASRHVAALQEPGDFRIDSIERKERRKRPLAPFTTSKLQQEASRRLRFSAKKTMMVAQSLYEGVSLGELGTTGLITYMRTDSTRVSQEAIDWARASIAETFGEPYLPSKPRSYASGKGNARTQDAHEAIRPTSDFHPSRIQAHLNEDQFRLYKLIYERFLASQMADAIIDSTAVNIHKGLYQLRANGNQIRFAGHLALYDSGAGENNRQVEQTQLPPLQEGEVLKTTGIKPQQHFTQPPPRYTEATLVKTLEEKGIGRPSTYAAILSTIEERRYVEREERKFTPTELGKLVNKLLVEHFPDLFDYNFTAELENRLDQVEEGECQWQDFLKGFYEQFTRELETAEERLSHIDKITITAEGVECPRCQSELNIKIGRNGQFLACSKYPDCTFTSNFRKDEDGRIHIEERPPEEVTDIKCQKCEKLMVVKMSRRGPFLACSGYPDCKNAMNFRRNDDGSVTPIEKKPAEPTDIPCPKCSEPMVVRSSRRGEFLGCSKFPKCRGTSNMERDENGTPRMVEKKPKAAAKGKSRKKAASKDGEK